mgnify:CR=1 FL=1|tara:strand:- start:736 stop:2742 length:2007 start_codon:yes stop_codon:yes gene_type:complete
MFANVKIRMKESKPNFFLKDNDIVLDGQRLDFSALTFLNISNSKKTPILSIVSNYIKNECVNVIYCDNDILDVIKNLSNSDYSDIKILHDADEFYNSIEIKEKSNVLILSCTAHIYLSLQAFLNEKNINNTTIRDIALDNFELIPDECFIPIEKNIYPIVIPPIKFEGNLDLILMDCPSRNLSMMPNGLGYVHNAIKKTGIKFTTYDLDIIAYHQFHMHRIYDKGGEIVLESGLVFPKDPWQAEFYDFWEDTEINSFFQPLIYEAAKKICEANPKMLGLSIQQCNTNLSRDLVLYIKKHNPKIKIVVGGFSCYNADIGFNAFEWADYMCIGESDNTVAHLVTKLAKGEEIIDMPGVLSRKDTPNRLFIPGPMPNNLDELDDPRYEWFPISTYRNWDGYQLTPVIASRGCRWSRCTFCAERFYWRVRDPIKFVDELEFLVQEGAFLFMFNESDLNGNPEIVLEICDEIIKRGLRIKLTAQLRIHKKADKAFFMKLKQAGFVALRFGVDAFSKNTMRLQKKGYTPATVEQNLRDCWESGIYTEVNWVIGVPGETEEDCKEGVEFILKNREYIGRIANINPLILVNGSVYWIDPESHGIKFTIPQEKIQRDKERNVPSQLWYSTDPYIDAAVRKRRFEDIVVSLIDNEFDLGPWAHKIYDNVKHELDKARA